MSRPWINLAVALPAEAKPLIRHFSLRRQQPDGTCPLYLGARMALVMTGCGAEAMRRGVDFLSGAVSRQDAYWLNLGIAGHGSLTRGTCLFATRIIAPGSGRRWQLPAPRIPGIAHSPLQCTESAESNYAPETGYDMESVGFATALSAIGALDRAAVLKVVSDGPNHPSGEINGRMVGDLVQLTIPVIGRLLQRQTIHA